MWRSQALVIAAHGVSKTHAIAHRRVCGHADRVTQGLAKKTEERHLASQLKTDQVHQVASRCFFSYYYKRVTFYGVIEKSHTYFQMHHQGQTVTSFGSSGKPSNARTDQTEDWHLASQLKTGQVHQVAMPSFFNYYYKRVTFYGTIKKSHTYF
jgi:hypothetical protein